MAALALLILSPPTQAIEEAAYEVLVSDGSFEIRDYAPQIVAQGHSRIGKRS